MARADEEVPSIDSHAKELRQGLRADGVLEESAEGLRFVRDYVFTSPSAAATALLGRAANGRIEWKDADGRTLREIQSTEVGLPVE